MHATQKRGEYTELEFHELKQFGLPLAPELEHGAKAFNKCTDCAAAGLVNGWNLINAPPTVTRRHVCTFSQACNYNTVRPDNMRIHLKQYHRWKDPSPELSTRRPGRGSGRGRGG